MIRLYQYIYYRIYSWNNYLWRNDEMSAFNSTLALTYSVVAFFLCGQVLIQRFQNFPIPNLLDNVYSTIGFVAVIFFANYWMLEHNEKYLAIAEKFGSGAKDKTDWRIKGLLVFILALGPIIAFYFIL